LSALLARPGDVSIVKGHVMKAHGCIGSQGEEQRCQVSRPATI